MEKKAVPVSELTRVGFSAGCCLIHDFPFLWKKVSAWARVPKPAFLLAQPSCFSCNFICGCGKL